MTMLEIIVGISSIISCYNLIKGLKKDTFSPYEKDMQELKEITFTILLHLSDNNHTGKMREVLEKYGKEIIK
jgi:hypothetical protein